MQGFAEPDGPQRRTEVALPAGLSLDSLMAAPDPMTPYLLGAVVAAVSGRLRKKASRRWRTALVLAAPSCLLYAAPAVMLVVVLSATLLP